MMRRPSKGRSDKEREQRGTEALCTREKRDREIKVCAVILNYRDADTTASLVASIRDYEALDFVLVVDNFSDDGSYGKLNSLAGDKVHVIGAKRNGGYGAGNNLGIRYAWRKLHASHVLVANPDVEFSEECVLRMRQTFEEEDGCGVISALVRDTSGRLLMSSWKLLGFWGDLLETGLFTRRLLKRWLREDPEKYEAAYRQMSGGLQKAAIPVDAVPGSLFMADIEALMDCGLFDEHVFLYYEEKILGQRMKKKGYQTLLLPDQSYIHRHSVSVDKSIPSLLKKQKLQHESKLYYYKRYLKINPFEELAARLSLSFLLGEIWFLTKVLKMTW